MEKSRFGWVFLNDGVPKLDMKDSLGIVPLDGGVDYGLDGLCLQVLVRCGLSPG